MLIPVGDRIVIQAVAVEKQTKSGLIIPDAHTEKPNTGNVVAVGEKQKSIRIGDIVLYGKYAGSEFKLHGDDYVVLDESDVLAKIRDDDGKA